MTFGQKLARYGSAALSVLWGIGSAVMSPQSGIINLMAHIATSGAIIGSAHLVYNAVKYTFNQAKSMAEDSEYLDATFAPETDSELDEDENEYEYDFEEISNREILNLRETADDAHGAAALGSDFDTDDVRSSNRLHNIDRNRRFH
tara:strand:+ start:80250 stop:80687 length:438 start_codon:yes stop_codon:yes gene_type:complete